MAQRSGVLKSVLRWLVPIVISATAFYLVLRNLDFALLARNFLEIGFRTILLATVVYFISLSFRVFCWYLLLNRRVAFKDVWFAMCAGYLLNNIFPFRLGEFGRALLLDSPKGPKALEVLSSVVVERIFDVFLAAVFVLAVLPRVIGGQFDQRLIMVALVLALVGLIILFAAARFRVQLNAWFAQLGQRSKFVGVWFAPKASQLMDGLAVLTNPAVFFLAFGSLAISWALAFGENLIIFRSLQPAAPYWWMMFVVSAASFGGSLPSVPAGLGVYEGVMVAAFALLGVDAETAFTHAIVSHMLGFAYANIIGLIGLRLRGQAIVSLYRRAIHRQPEGDQPTG